MIIPNGQLEVKRKSVSGHQGVDLETGYAVRPSSQSWGKPFPCQYMVSKYDALARSGGEPVTKATYQVLIEEQAQPFAAEQVRLTDLSGREIGTFSIIQVEPLAAVGEVRLWI